MEKERAIYYCNKYPKKILNILTENNFEVAKTIWGNEWEIMKMKKKGLQPVTQPEILLESWKYHLKRIVTSKDRIKYLEDFI